MAKKKRLKICVCYLVRLVRLVRLVGRFCFISVGGKSLNKVNMIQVKAFINEGKHTQPRLLLRTEKVKKILHATPPPHLPAQFPAEGKQITRIL